MVGNSFLENSLIRIDFLGELPAEVGLMVLRRLDPESLHTVTLVSKKWHALCLSDAVLWSRMKINLQIRNIMARLDVKDKQLFASMNIRHRIKIVKEPADRRFRSDKLQRNKEKPQPRGRYLMRWVPVVGFTKKSEFKLAEKAGEPMDPRKIFRV